MIRRERVEPGNGLMVTWPRCGADMSEQRCGSAGGMGNVHNKTYNTGGAPRGGDYQRS